MKLTIIPDDSLIIRDGVALKTDFSLIPVDVSNVRAIHFDDARTPPGEMEFRDGTHNLPFTDPASLQPFIDKHEAVMALVSQQLPLPKYKALKLSQLERAAGSNITAGFNCSALGAVHRYGGKETDQINLIGAASTGLDLPFPCADENDAWARRLHTAAQLQQVLMAGAGYKQTILITLDGLREQVDAAADHAAVDAIEWVEV